MKGIILLISNWIVFTGFSSAMVLSEYGQANATTRICEKVFPLIMIPLEYTSTNAIVVVFNAIVLFVFLFIYFLYTRKKIREKVNKIEARKTNELEKEKKVFEEEVKKKERELVALRKQISHLELSLKDKELINSTVKIVHRNEIFLQLKSIIRKIKEEMEISEDPELTFSNLRIYLDRIQEEINQNIEVEDDWIKFAEYFDTIYNGFLKRVQNNFPQLTKNDLKLCAYLKMGFSSKDIASLQNSTFRSVEMSRHRLRKKFNLSRDINLNDFLDDYQ